MKRSSSSAVDSVKLHFFGDNSAKVVGCAYAAIALLTGEDPFTLRKRYKKEGMAPATMTRHLKNLGFELIKIDTPYLYKLLARDVYITDYHVVLASVRMTQREASWVVMYGGTMWHNFTPASTSYVSSLSFPLEYAWTLYLPEWRTSLEGVNQEKRKFLAKLRKTLNVEI